MQVLETDRLLLRHLTVDDAAFILELLNEPGWLRHIGDRGVRSLDDARAYVERGPRAMYQRHGFGLLAIERKRDGVPVGICGLLQRDNFPEVDLGYALLERYAGQGYAREAALVCLAQAWRDFGLRRVVALTALDNEPSIRLLEKVGFVFEKVITFGPAGAKSRLFVYTVPVDDAKEGAR